MKILIVCSGKPSNPKWSFELTRSYVYEQAESTKKLGVEYETYFIEGKGVLGYLKNYKKMVEKINLYKPDIIHAHYGLSGLLANLQRKVSVITTFHGSDINLKSIRPLSYMASRLSADNIFVHENQPEKINYKNEINLIPCGVDIDIFFPIDKSEARNKLKLEKNKKYGLFAGSFTNFVKNYSLAKEVLLKSRNEIELLELKGYTREEVCLLMNAVDFLIITSHSETGPIVAKEAMCCNCPIISVDVGDVKSVIYGTKNSYITDYNSNEISSCIDKVLIMDSRTNGREHIAKYSLENIAQKVIKIYKKVII